MRIAVIGLLTLVLIGVRHPCRAADDTIRDHVCAAFDAGVEEHSAARITQGALVNPKASPGGPEVVFVPSPLFYAYARDPFHAAVLSRSASVQDLVEWVHRRATTGSPSAARAACQAAAVFLDHGDPRYRAVACEFLGQFPIEAVGVGLVPHLGALLSDSSFAFKAAAIDTPQQGPPRVSGAVDFAVTDAARAALAALTGFEFPDQATFDIWWRANSDYRNRLWYWGVRWMHLDPDRDALSVYALDPEVGLKMLVLAPTNARPTEAALPWLAAGDTRPPHEILPASGMYVRHAHPRRISRYITLKRLKPTVLQLLSGRESWPEVTEGRYARETSAQMVQVLTQACYTVLTRDDVPALEQMLDSPEGPLGNSLAAQERVALLAASLDRDRAEDILLTQLGRGPDQPDVITHLMFKTELKHWDLIRRAYPDLPWELGKPLVVGTLANMDADVKPALMELLQLSDLSASSRGAADSDERQKQILLCAFAEAAQIVNHWVPVVDDDLLARAQFQWGKGDEEQQREWDRHNQGVPAARAEAVTKLKEFFAH